MNNAKAHKSRVVLVEDHPMFREQLTQLISKEPSMMVCGCADNIQDALRLIEAEKRHAVPLDFR